MGRAVRIVTHDGPFHLDDVLGCHILATIHKSHELVRTREDALFSDADFLVDVGGVYDPERRRYDHHQRGFDETYSEKYRVLMSSSGMVFKHHIREYLEAIGVRLGESERELAIEQLYRDYFLYVDAHDNGYDVADRMEYIPRELADVVRTMIPITPVGSCCEAAPEEQAEETMRAFTEAMKVVGDDLQREIQWVVRGWLPTLPIVEKAFQENKGERYIVIKRHCYFGSFIPELNRKYGRSVLFVIYQLKPGFFKIVAASKEHARFKSVLPLKEPWRGKRGEDLSRAVGIGGCIFVHHSGFCGAHQTLEGAIHMVEETVKDARMGMESN